MWADEWSALAKWCLDELGAEPVRELFGTLQASHVAASNWPTAGRS